MSWQINHTITAPFNSNKILTNGLLVTHLINPVLEVTGGVDQIQSDWNQANNEAVDYIKNKPSIPAAQVNSDWNSISGVSQILNKPTIPDQLSDLSDDTTHRLVTDTEKSTWNGKLSSYTETDPVFVASQAHNITSTHITVLNNTSGTNTGDQDLSNLQIINQKNQANGYAGLGSDGYLLPNIVKPIDNLNFVGNLLNQNITTLQKLADFIDQLNISSIPRLSAPILESVTATSDTQLSVNWTDPNTSINELSYEICFDFESNFPNPTITTALQNALSVTIENLVQETLYFIRVRAIGDGITKLTSLWSNVEGQTTQTTPIILEDFGLTTIVFDESKITKNTSNLVSAVDDSSDNNNDLAIHLNNPEFIDFIKNSKDGLVFSITDIMRLPISNIHSNDNGMFLCFVFRNNNGVTTAGIFGNATGCNNTGGHGVTGTYSQYYKGFRLFNNKVQFIQSSNFENGKITSFSLPNSLFCILTINWLPGFKPEVRVNGTLQTQQSDIVLSIMKAVEDWTAGNSHKLFFNLTGYDSSNGTTITGDNTYLYFKADNKSWSKFKQKQLLDKLAIDFALESEIDTSSLTETQPTVSNAVIGRQANNIIRIYFNTDVLISDSVPTNAFSIVGGTGNPTISNVIVKSGFIHILLSSDCVNTDNITISYVKPITGFIKTFNGLELASFSDLVISNFILNDSTSIIAVDARFNSGFSFVNGNHNNNLNQIKDRYNRFSGTRNNTTNNYEPKLYELWDGLKHIQPQEYSLAYRVYWNFGDIITFDNINGMTLFFVGLFYDPSNIRHCFSRAAGNDTQTDFYLSATNFTIRDAGATERAASHVIPSSTPVIIAARWIPGTEQKTWINGVAGTAAATPATSITKAATLLSIAGDNYAYQSYVMNGIFMYASAFNSAFSNSELKSKIELLSNIWRIPVNTLGIV